MSKAADELIAKAKSILITPVSPLIGRKLLL
jgi:hypothetical protein